MLKQIEAKYTVFDSIADMLAPESLSNLLATPISRAEVVPMNGHGGLAGGHLNYVNTDAGRLVLKRMSMETDWIMFASNDQQCRSVTIWQYGLLDQLRPHLEHKITACARDNNGWAILMHDLTGNVYTWENAMAPELVPTFLDRLARLHATYWNDPSLKDPKLGLCILPELLEATALSITGEHPEFASSPLPEWISKGWESMAEMLPSETFETMRRLVYDPQPLLDAIQCHPFTMLHGDFRADNLAYLEPDCPIALDWQQATCSLMTMDLAWFIKQGYVRDVMGYDQAIGYYRDRLELYLGERIADQEWQAMLELGQCVDALRSTCFPAFFYHVEADPARRSFNERQVKEQGQRVMTALRWL